jgi:hypothetical protein
MSSPSRAVSSPKKMSFSIFSGPRPAVIRGNVRVPHTELHISGLLALWFIPTSSGSFETSSTNFSSSSSTLSFFRSGRGVSISISSPSRAVSSPRKMNFSIFSGPRPAQRDFWRLGRVTPLPFLCASGPGPGGHAPKASRSSCLRSPSGMSSPPRCFTVHPARGHLPFVNFVSKSIPCKQAAPVSSLILFITLIIRLGKGR